LPFIREGVYKNAPFPWHAEIISGGDDKCMYDMRAKQQAAAASHSAALVSGRQNPDRVHLTYTRLNAMTLKNSPKFDSIK